MAKNTNKTNPVEQLARLRAANAERREQLARLCAANAERRDLLAQQRALADALRGEK